MADTHVNLNHNAKAEVTRGAYRHNRYVMLHFETVSNGPLRYHYSRYVTLKWLLRM
ncbi:unnamed protein product [Camellia sinensis]